MDVVFDSISYRDRQKIEKLIKQGTRIWIIEPFYSYHHRNSHGGTSFYPRPLPDFINHYLENGRVNLISADSLEAFNISTIAADKAVETIESVFPVYKQKHASLIDYVSKILKNQEADSIFKLKLGERLAEFYSFNIMLKRVEAVLEVSSILLYSQVNIAEYNTLNHLVISAGCTDSAHSRIRIKPRSVYKDKIINIYSKLDITLKLAAQTIASFFSLFRIKSRRHLKQYKFGVTIIAPLRQLNSLQRGPDFIIDGQKITKEEVVFIPVTRLDEDQQKKLEKLGCDVEYSYMSKLYLSNFWDWVVLLILVAKSGLQNNSEEVKSSGVALSNYFKWLDGSKKIKISNLITHADFGRDAIARNIALKQVGTQTWYYNDSMNSGCNFQTDTQLCRHPFWSYMNYDHLVTWNDFLGDYLRSHPGSFANVHVTGCLWSSFVQDVELARESNPDLYTKGMKGHLIIGAFDSTFTFNSFTSYKEGIAFAEHLLQMVEQMDDLFILFKEKKNRSLHKSLDPVLGRKLEDLYNKMEGHSRIKMLSNETETSGIMAVCDAIISFPFTSTTYEFLSVARPAIWHDPCGLYYDTPFGRDECLTTHSFDELVKWLKNVETWDISLNSRIYESEKLFPYLDGKAVNRFRDLLYMKWF
ncbi:polysaccharide biosynthesis PFTS motif protein [bacterium]|nr:polysaccharide biosynthesis PFTS motif protein [bacterium]